MNDLQKLLKLRGITLISLAADIGEEYTSVHKVVSRARYINSRGTGTILVRKNPRIRNKIADYLKLSYEQTWSRQSSLFLHRLIRNEIKKKAKEKEAELAAEFLPDENRISEEKVARNG